MRVVELARGGGVEGWRGPAGSEERPVRVQAATGPDGAAGLR